MPGQTPKSASPHGRINMIRFLKKFIRKTTLFVRPGQTPESTPPHGRLKINKFYNKSTIKTTLLEMPGQTPESTPPGFQTPSEKLLDLRTSKNHIMVLFAPEGTIFFSEQNKFSIKIDTKIRFFSGCPFGERPLHFSLKKDLFWLQKTNPISTS